jgi:uncharacterized protein (DUF779 family)
VAGAAFGAVFISALWAGLSYYRIVYNLAAMLLIYFVLFAAGLSVLRRQSGGCCTGSAIAIVPRP